MEFNKSEREKTTIKMNGRKSSTKPSFPKTKTILKNDYAIRNFFAKPLPGL